MNQFLSRQLSRKLPLKDLTNGLSVGLPGLEKSRVTPFSSIHLSGTREANYGPLSALVRMRD